MNKLYLDGCSFTYGLGLPHEDTLEHLFTSSGYDVSNNSRNGKSNLAIAMDAYKNIDNHDVIVLGFTFSGRFYINHSGHKIDFQPIYYYHQFKPNDDYNSAAIEDEYSTFHKHFYTLYQAPFCDDLSDCLIDTLSEFIKSKGKKLIVFSWEKRNVNTEILYPYIGPRHRLSDGHLNSLGTRYLFDLLQSRLGEQ
jgi:hypothetical protein